VVTQLDGGFAVGSGEGCGDEARINYSVFESASDLTYEVQEQDGGLGQPEDENKADKSGCIGRA